MSKRAGHPFRYFVELRDIHSDDPDSSYCGYLHADGTLVIPAGQGSCDERIWTAELVAELVTLVSFDERGRLRTVEERKRIAALAETHGYRIARGARPNHQPEDVLRLRDVKPACAHETIDHRGPRHMKHKPYQCRACDETFDSIDIVYSGDRLRLRRRRR